MTPLLIGRYIYFVEDRTISEHFRLSIFGKNRNFPYLTEMTNRDVSSSVSNEIVYVND